MVRGRPDLTVCPGSRQVLPVQLHNLTPVDHCPTTTKRTDPCPWVTCQACGWVIDRASGACIPGPQPPRPARGA